MKHWIFNYGPAPLEIETPMGHYIIPPSYKICCEITSIKHGAGRAKYEVWPDDLMGNTDSERRQTPVKENKDLGENAV